MPKSRKNVCRITWRKGEPLGLVVSTTACFLDLPREIRDRIYFHTLVSSTPITTSSVTLHGSQCTSNDANQTVISRAYTVEGQDPILQQLATSLLFCHPTIASEAAKTFYQSNTFYFKGNEIWNPLYFFLQGIGDYNRGFLSKLSAKVEIPSFVAQDRYGVRIITNYDLPFNIVHSSASNPPPRLQYPHRQTHDEYYPYQFLDPAIQACFRILGPDGPPIVMSLDLEYRGNGIQGLDVWLGRYPESIVLPDLADYIESLRRAFAGRVDVLWNGYCGRDRFIKETDSIQDNGWEIVDTREGEFPLTTPVGVPPRPPYLIMHFILRRKATHAVQTPPKFCESCCIRNQTLASPPHNSA